MKLEEKINNIKKAWIIRKEELNDRMEQLERKMKEMESKQEIADNEKKTNQKMKTEKQGKTRMVRIITEVRKGLREIEEIKSNVNGVQKRRLRVKEMQRILTVYNGVKMK